MRKEFAHALQAAGRGRTAEQQPARALGIVQRTLSRIGSAIQDCASHPFSELPKLQAVSCEHSMHVHQAGHYWQTLT